MALPPFLASIVGWVQAGYSQGVPTQDYVPLFALLASQLTQDELQTIAEALAGAADPPSVEAIRAAIAGVTHAEPLDADVANVRAHLAAGGWPLAEPARTDLTG